MDEFRGHGCAPSLAIHVVIPDSIRDPASSFLNRLDPAIVKAASSRIESGMTMKGGKKCALLTLKGREFVPAP
ncbi:hypothetical protein SLG_09230 [Sphingobium sp. SYK-6]|nr:hypothetical protein SLG_09230 [Sphingobium sp. SYK-6]